MPYDRLIGPDTQRLINLCEQKLGQPPIQGKVMQLFANECKGSLLLFHGDQDINVPFSEMELYQKDLIKANVKCVPLKNTDHWMEKYMGDICNQIDSFLG